MKKEDKNKSMFSIMPAVHVYNSVAVLISDNKENIFPNPCLQTPLVVFVPGTCVCAHHFHNIAHNILKGKDNFAKNFTKKSLTIFNAR